MLADEIYQRLIAAKEKLHERKKLQDNLARVEQSLSKHKTRLSQLEGELKKEGADIKKLEGLSLTGLFHAILGSKEEQLNKEHQEYLSAKLRYDKARALVNELEQAQADLQANLDRLGDLDEEYRSLIDARERFITDSDSTRADELGHLSEQLAEAQRQEKELQEAIQAGKAVLSALREGIESLHRAGNWGTWDMLGGGILVTAAKHSHIDQARQSIHSVQVLLERFQRELTDVQFGPDSVLAIDISSFDTFADYFIDGLIVDWVIQARIHDSLERAEHMETTIEKLIAHLQRSLGGIRRRVVELQERRQNFLESK